MEGKAYQIHCRRLSLRKLQTLCEVGRGECVVWHSHLESESLGSRSRCNVRVVVVAAGSCKKSIKEGTSAFARVNLILEAAGLV